MGLKWKNGWTFLSTFLLIMPLLEGVRHHSGTEHFHTPYLHAPTVTPSVAAAEPVVGSRSPAEELAAEYEEEGKRLRQMEANVSDLFLLLLHRTFSLPPSTRVRRTTNRGFA